MKRVQPSGSGSSYQVSSSSDEMWVVPTSELVALCDTGLLVDQGVRELSHRLHSITELESIPTILLNSPVPSWSEHQRYHTIFLSLPFALGDLYAAVNESLGRI